MADTGLFGKTRNPDVLTCLANLSSDEVFTPPDLVNQMLDMLPQELFSNPNTTFLDPASKTGVFLREIAKRLINGLKSQFPDRQELVDHIMHKQLFGIAITELTSLMSRRSVYCSKCPNSEFSVSHFDDEQGNIRYERLNHSWENGRCKFCGANQSQYYERDEEFETHAYEFIHTQKPEEIFNMKFDVIISNPPYQLTDSSLSASASPIYNLFVKQAKKLQPKYLAMIIPSRWMVGGKGLDQFRNEMLEDKHITQLHDYGNSKDCFPSVDIKGGICYFLRESNREAKCKIVTHNAGGAKTSIRYLKEDGVEVFIRQSELIDIKEKVWADYTQKSFSNLVSSQKPYGFRTDFFTPTIQKEVHGKMQKVPVTTEEKYGLVSPSDKPFPDGYEIIGLVRNKRTWKYVDKNYAFPKSDGLGKYKIFIPNAYGCGALGEVPSTPVQACTETFLEIGLWDNEEEAINALKYLQTKFFRCLVGIYKQTQDASNRIYGLVPIQDFTSASDIDWSQSVDDISHQLYKKYHLSKEEIAFIERMIKPMGIT